MRARAIPSNDGAFAGVGRVIQARPRTSAAPTQYMVETQDGCCYELTRISLLELLAEWLNH